MARYTQYTWIFVGIGANDVANSFGSSVGAKALTMPQAILVAAVCEFLGALLLGAGVTDTIRSKISRLSEFQKTPDLFLYGMMSALIATGFWDNLACHLELPVSTTHTTVGAVVGMSMAIRGGGAVVWSAHQDPFPYLTGMSTIFLSWVISPIVSGIVCTALFFVIRTFILRSKHSFNRALFTLPILVGGTFWLITSFIIQTGNKNKTWEPAQPDTAVAWIGACVGGGMGLITLLIIMPLIRRRILKNEELASHALSVENGPATHTVVGPDGTPEKRAVGEGHLHDPATGATANLPDNKPVGEGADGLASVMPKAVAVKLEGTWDRIKNSRFGIAVNNNRVFRTLTYGARYKIHDTIPKDSVVNDIWERAEVFDYNTEMVFRHLQVFTAMVMSFAHGSNDVANAMGPYSAIWSVWDTETVPSKTSVPTWILAYGGAGIVIGLATYGYNIMKVFGVKSVKLTNSRGFCMELSTAITVVVASRYGLPVSTTQVLTGALLAIGLFEGAKGVNWRMFLRIFVGWVMTLVVAGLVAASIAAWGVYSPNKVGSDAAVFTANTLQPQMLRMNRELFATAAATNNAVLTQTVQGFNASLASLYKSPVKDIDNIVTLQSQIFPVFNTSECINPAVAG